MALIRWQPLRDLDSLRTQMDQLFEDLIHGEYGLPLFASRESKWVPAIEVEETEKDLLLKAEVPGIAAEDLDIQVSETSVFLGGEHRQEQQPDTKALIDSEFHYGPFHRTIPLPVPVLQDQVQAAFSQGVLTLTLPKRQAATRQTVKVDLAAG